MSQQGLMSSRVISLKEDPDVQAGDCIVRWRGESTGADPYLTLTFLMRAFELEVWAFFSFEP